MTFIQIYLYKIPTSKVDRFKEILQKVSKIYYKYGIDGENLYRLDNQESVYGVTGIWEVLQPARDENIWVGIVKFRDKNHCEDAMKQFDNDLSTNKLYKEFVETIIPASEVVRGEFQLNPYEE